MIKKIKDKKKTQKRMPMTNKKKNICQYYEKKSKRSYFIIK
jgi:hypothetical protein